MNVVDFLGSKSGYSGEHQFASNMKHRPSRGLELGFKITVANAGTAAEDAVVDLGSILLRVKTRHYGDLVATVPLLHVAYLNLLKGIMPRGQSFAGGAPAKYTITGVPASGTTTSTLYVVHMFEDPRFRPVMGALNADEIESVKLTGDPDLTGSGADITLSNVDVTLISYGFKGKNFLPAPFKVSIASDSRNPISLTGDRIVDAVLTLPSGQDASVDRWSVKADGVDLGDGDREAEYYGLVATLDMDHDYRSVIIDGMAANAAGIVPVIRMPQGGAITKAPRSVKMQASANTLSADWTLVTVTPADPEGRSALKVATEQQHSLADFQPITRIGTRPGAKRPPLPGLIPYRLR